MIDELDEIEKNLEKISGTNWACLCGCREYIRLKTDLKRKMCFDCHRIYTELEEKK